MSSRKKMVIATTTIVAVVALAATAWLFRHSLPWAARVRQVEVEAYYALNIDDKPLVYYLGIGADSTLVGVSLRPESHALASMASGMDGDSLLHMVCLTKTKLREEIDYCEGTMAEMDYYLEVHGVQDEGYDMVAKHSTQTAQAIDSLRQLLDVLEGIDGKAKLTALRTTKTTRLDSICPAPLMVITNGGTWRRGRRLTRIKDGRGIATDSMGRVVRGWWQADTIAYAWRTDSLGTYQGAMNSRLVAEGHGTYAAMDGSYYEGHWANDELDGFGWHLSSDKLRAGEWQNGRYRGERMSYTSERIYGIDISRYQHGRGRKYHPIHWDRLRITHLGRHNNKRVEGEADYPVSFIYIKSTEGTSVRNPHYRQDYLQARKRGLLCGAYHFFSTRTPAADQAQYFIKHSMFRSGDLPPVLDVEPTDAQIASIGGSEALFDRIRTWMNIVRRHTGIRPILYVNQRFVNKYLVDAPDIKRDYKVWIARYGEYKPDVKLLFWQMCHDGKVTGIVGDVDINVFNGYQEQFTRFTEMGLIE